MSSRYTEFVFYSGGYDTTFYLLDCLLLKHINVQPIVVKVPDIDGIGKDRLSLKQEEVSRNNFYNKFRKKYPELADNLLEEIVYENETILDNDTLNIGLQAYDKNIFSRKINQLLYFHQACKDNNIINPVIGYQKDDSLTEEGIKFFKDILNFRIPLIETSKQQMLDIATINGFDSFLYETWSCWNPLPGNKPCGVCALCEITIVDTKLEFPKSALI